MHAPKVRQQLAETFLQHTAAPVPSKAAVSLCCSTSFIPTQPFCKQNLAKSIIPPQYHCTSESQLRPQRGLRLLAGRSIAFAHWQAAAWPSLTGRLQLDPEVYGLHCAAWCAAWQQDRQRDSSQSAIAVLGKAASVHKAAHGGAHEAVLHCHSVPLRFSSAFCSPK